ncbi:hypothetical protein DY218_20735 [Streptomyces triticagri]|uniref:Uncharacterized protein n=1 Tax=Streptomyces triticagri TaxID=2293568 RepID=A0A372M1V7_9ACTN|nr:hypothetical protein DY218_20735 [Streptomyces triticagri]
MERAGTHPEQRPTSARQTRIALLQAGEDVNRMRCPTIRRTRKPGWTETTAAIRLIRWPTP